MSVYTAVTREQLANWLANFDAGAPSDIRGIAEGIQNSNFFVDTDAGRYVLTLFERVDAGLLPFYLELMAQLAARGIACPAPLPDRGGRLLGTLNGRPAALFSRLPGTAVAAPTPAHCTAVGTTLAQLHLAGRDIPAPPHPRGRDWIEATAARLLPQLADDNARLLANEVAHLRATARPLPGGVIHADLFRDNVLFVDERIGGLLDFYFAGAGEFLFDLAVVANDWCNGEDGRLDPVRTRALLAAYSRVRPLTAAERAAWPDSLRTAALRFWLSRLDDFHTPAAGENVTVRDPAVFGALLRQRAENPESCPV